MRRNKPPGQAASVQGRSAYLRLTGTACFLLFLAVVKAHLHISVAMQAPQSAEINQQPLAGIRGAFTPENAQTASKRPRAPSTQQQSTTLHTWSGLALLDAKFPGSFVQTTLGGRRRRPQNRGNVKRRGRGKRKRRRAKPRRRYSPNRKNERKQRRTRRQRTQAKEDRTEEHDLEGRHRKSEKPESHLTHGDQENVMNRGRTPDAR
ncbi:putative transmembrane protein, partial [Toxoplasma gondii TgCatPRC2]